MSLLAPLALAGFALAIPIVLLYMLRLRRREVQVSSTFLWQQVLRDREANTPWQKLRRNLLLLLQLIALALIVLALTRPFMVVPGLSTARTALLIDASQSMNATDSADGTRFAEAVRRARETVETLAAGSEASILWVGDAVQVAAPYTADRAALQSALDGLAAGGGGADWQTAFTLTEAGAAGAASFAVVLFSDGGGLSGGLPVLVGEADFQYVRVGASGDNVAVSAMAVDALPGQPPQLFARLTNYGLTEAEVVFDVRVDGDLLTARRETIPAASDLPFTVANLPVDFTHIQAGITRPAGALTADHLAADDSAFAVARPEPTRRVLLMSATGNLFLEEGLRALPGVELFTVDVAGGLPAGAFDLVVLDGWLPPVLPGGDLLVVNPPADTPFFTRGTPLTVTDSPAAFASPRLVRGGVAGDGQTLDLALVEAAGVSAVNVGAFTPIDGAALSPVLAVDGGALVQAGTVAGQQIAVFGFDLRQSDLPLQIAFPALLAALLDWYAPATALDAPAAALTGEALTVRPPLDAVVLRAIAPDGTVTEIAIDRARLTVPAAGQPGIYTLEALDAAGAITATARTAITAYRAAESDLLPREVVQVGGQAIDGAPLEQTGQREYWPWLALAALIVLGIEWAWFHRRMMKKPTWAALRSPTRSRSAR